MKGRISVRGNNAGKTNKKLTFKNNVPFRSYISKINNIKPIEAQQTIIVY